MSSSRYPDNRYPRERSPFRDRRPSTYTGSTYPPRPSDSGPRSNAESSGFPPRETPRGPKSSLADGPRGPPASVPSGAPSAPRDGRGRGFAGRGEAPSLRDAPPLSSVAHPHPHNTWRPDRDRDRDFDRDRRDRRPSPRRSPVRDLRDNRDQRDFPPRDVDIGRARRNSRDGPPSAGSTYSDPPLSVGSSYRGSGFGRGRGGRDFQPDGRGRGRPPYADDRDRHHDARDRMPDRSYRPRSRSRDPVRRDRDPRDARDSRDERDRDFDRRDRDDRRYPPREYDSYIGPAGAKPGPRALDTHRGSAQIDPRHLPNTPTGTTPHSQHHSPADRHGPPMDSYSRRPSVATEPPKDNRREPGRDDMLASRAEASRERYAPRASSPPAAVPAFGSNVWRNPLLDAKPAPAPQPPKVPPPAPSAPAQPAPSTATPATPTAPKASIPSGLAVAPPTGPRADRVPERQHSDSQIQSPAQGPIQGPDHRAAVEPRPEQRPEPRSMVAPPTPNPPPPSAPTESKPSIPTTPSAPQSTAPPPTGPASANRAPPTGPQAALRPNVSPSFPRPARLPYMGGARDASPNAMQPTMGPRSGSGSGPSPMLPNTSPKALPANIPTGPKADRGNPNAPRAPMFPPPDRPGFLPPRLPSGAPPKSMQWVRPGLNINNRTTLPTKREFPADSGDRTFGNAPKAPKFEANSSVSDSQPPEKAKSVSPSFVRPTMGAGADSHRRASAEGRRVPSPKPAPIETRRFSNVSMTDAPAMPDKPPASAASSAPEMMQDSDDDLDLDEDDFAESEAKYNREKALLESKRIDLSASNLRATTPLQEIMLLASLTTNHLPQEEPIPTEEEPAMVVAPSKESPESLPQQELVANELPTPKAEAEEPEDVSMVDKEEERQLAPATRALRMRPGINDDADNAADFSSLPFLGSGPPTPISEMEGPRVSDSVMVAIRSKLQKSIEPESEIDDALEQYAATYRQWRLKVRHLDSATDVDSLERPASAEPTAKVSTPGVETANTVPLLDAPPPTTGRRGHAARWATEFDLELAMQESLRTAELEREQQEKEPRRSMADPEKEAEVPLELTAYEAQRRRFIDTNFQREPGQGIFAFHYEPPEDDFTEEEHRIMVYQYRDQYAKKWGKLAEILYKEAGTSRTYKDCINHYYATKWQREYKGKLRRRRGAATKRGGATGRARGAIANMDRPDASTEDGLPPALTETGRPRRSAAPTFGAETEADSTTSTPNAGRVRRQADTDGTSEKTARRGKTAKEKGGRKTKAAPPLAAAPVGSPVKLDRKSLGVKMEDEFAKMGEVVLPTPIMQEEQMVLQAEQPYHPMHAGMSMADRQRLQQPSSARPSPSSYWSVTEQTDFQKNVAHFGTDWAAIAAHMGTKTQTMVKNQYLRLIESGSTELERAAKAADERRTRGDDLGMPPAPTPAQKRRYESTQVTVPRPLAPTPETAGLPIGLKGSPPSMPSSRFPNIAQAPQSSKPLVPGGPYSMTDPSLVSIPQQQQSPPVHAARQQMPPHMSHVDARRTGPLAGYFSDEPRMEQRMEHRPPSRSSNIPPSSRALQPHAQPMIQQQTMFRPSPLQDREPQHDRYQPSHSRHASREMHHGQHFGSAVPMRGPGAGSPEAIPAPLQHRLQQPMQEPPVHAPTSLPPAQHPPHAALATPPVKEEQRHYSISHGQPQPPPMRLSTPGPAYAPSPLPPQPPQAAPSASKPPAEKKKSNLMSLLNDDAPEEPKKKKPEQFPPPQQSAPPTVPQPMPRREQYGETTTQPPFSRPSYAQQPALSQGPGRQVVDLTREQAAAGRSAREEWPRQFSGHSQAQQGPAAVNSPRMSVSQPSYGERPFLGNHRQAFLAQHNNARHNPSPPPPMTAFSNSPHLHSRTPSISGPPGGQPRHGLSASTSSQHAQGPAGTSQILQPNPYAQVDPPGAAQTPGPVGMRPSPHLHTSHVVGQREMHARNEQPHNGGLPYSNPQTPNEQHPGSQHMRGPSVHEFRRDPREMHHEFDPRTNDRDMSREIQNRADALLRERDPHHSRSAGPPSMHQDPRYQPGPQPQDRPYTAQRSHTPLSRPDHGAPPLQHPPHSSLGDHHPIFNHGPRPDDRFRDPFARSESRLREEQHQHQREDMYRERERREMDAQAQAQAQAHMQRDRMMGRGPPPPPPSVQQQQQQQQGPPGPGPGPEQRGTPAPGPGGPSGPPGSSVDWTKMVPRREEWRR